jgi:hypothetical protein
MKRIEPPLNNTGTNHIYFNDEWNDPRDEDHEDFVDTYIEPKQDTTYYDDYEDYGN